MAGVNFHSLLFWDAAQGSYIYVTNQLISSQLIKQLMHASHAFVVLFVARKSLFCAMHAAAQCCIPKKKWMKIYSSHSIVFARVGISNLAIILLLSAGRESASFSLFFFALLAHACRRAWRPYSRTNGRRPWGREVVAMHDCMHGPATQKGRGRMMHSARPADKRRKIVFYSLKCRWGFSDT